jgi:leucyl aminopeptidase
MGAFLGVAQASDLPPKFIHLTYTPAGTPRRKLAIIGKGLTFDSGGLNIKGAGSGIEMMKTDMGGAGATLGAAKAIAQIQPDVEVHFISAATENMISGHAIHPGDILTASNGKTIEINNTDAEGRLTLADALVFAEKLGVDAIVDLATLTGACVVALGDDIAGLWSPSDAIAQELTQAGALAGEKIWQMPIEEKYFEGLKSGIADMKNTGPRAGGAITAALFLKQFVKETPWAHLDVAGPVWADKENGYNSAGATGYGVRTLVNWVLGLA